MSDGTDDARKGWGLPLDDEGMRALERAFVRGTGRRPTAKERDALVAWVGRVFINQMLLGQVLRGDLLIAAAHERDPVFTCPQHDRTRPQPH